MTQWKINTSFHGQLVTGSAVTRTCEIVLSLFICSNLKLEFTVRLDSVALTLKSPQVTSIQMVNSNEHLAYLS